MSSPTRVSAYVDMNVRDLFEKNTVEQVKDIHKKVNVDIERKREELRMLVGERYRDLIDAADTIGTMRTSSASVFEKLTSLRQKQNSLPTQLISNKLQKTCIPNKLSHQEFEIAAELKLSLETFRQVQQRLEKKLIIQATHLSLYYTKKLSVNLMPYKKIFRTSSTQANEDTSDPVFSIKYSIINACDNAIQDFDASPELLVECIVSKQILLQCPCEEIITNLLSTRVHLSEADLINDDSLFVQNISLTVHGLYCIFIDPQLYNAAAKEIRKPKMSMEGFGVKFLPQSVEDFRNELLFVEEAPRVVKLAELLLQFYIVPLRQALEKAYQDKVYLTESSSLKDMESYRNVTTSILKDKCEDFMRIVLGTTKSLWSEVFYPVFRDKCQDVALTSINSIFSFLANDAFPRYQKLDLQFDLVSFLWKPSAITEKPNLKDDDLKLKCLSPHVADLCRELEERFKDLMVDFQCLGDFSLKQYISAQIVESFSNFVSSKQSNEEDLFSGRFSSAVNDLCPTLWKLLEKKDCQRLLQLLASLSENCWTNWSEGVLQKFSANLEHKMQSFREESIMAFMPVGEEYTSEGDESFKPSIRVPLQISQELNSQLFLICVELASVGPQSVPKSVRENFRKAVGLKVVSSYEKLLETIKPEDEKEQPKEQIPPQVAVQLLFDMKFVQWFHQKLVEVVDPLAEQLQKVIDPFDLDIVNPRLKVNLKRFLFETHLTLGLLISEESHSFIAQNFKTKQNQVFPLSNPTLTTPLPLLPV